MTTTTTIARKKSTGEPGNGGEFARSARDEAGVTLPAEAVTVVKSDDLRPGDVYLYQHGDTVHRITVLGNKEDAPNQFGLPWFRFMSRSEDGRTGYMTYGPGADINVIDRDTDVSERANLLDLVDKGLVSSETTGAWTVAVTMNEAYAVRKDEDIVHSTSVIRFPSGWRVGKIWRAGTPPNTVIAAAKRLARELL